MIASLLTLAGTVQQLIAKVGKPAVATGRAVMDLLEDAKEVASTTDQAALQSRLDALQAEVNAHADRTIDSLGDG